MENNKDYLIEKAKQLDLGRGMALVIIQKRLNKLHPQLTRAISIKNDNLKIVTPSASLASDLRLGQIKLISDLNKLLEDSYKIDKITIQIREL